MPGKYGGMIDLTVVAAAKEKLNPTEVFGIDEEPDIPFHCVNHLGQGFQIKIYDSLNLETFN